MAELTLKIKTLLSKAIDCVLKLIFFITVCLLEEKFYMRHIQRNVKPSLNPANHVIKPLTA